MNRKDQMKINGKNRYNKLKAAGKCVVCTSPATKTRCKRCMIIATRFKEIRRANELCVICAKPNDRDKQECSKCSQARIERRNSLKVENEQLKKRIAEKDGCAKD